MLAETAQQTEQGGALMAQIPRAQLVVQCLVVVIALVVAQQIARMLQLDHAGGVLSVASLATVVVCARLGWRQALLGVGGLAVLSVPAVFSLNDPLLATLVLMAAGLGLGISARWQLKPVYWLLVVSLCMLITNSPLTPGPLGHTRQGADTTCAVMTPTREQIHAAAVITAVVDSDPTESW